MSLRFRLIVRRSPGWRALKAVIHLVSFLGLAIGAGLLLKAGRIEVGGGVFVAGMLAIIWSWRAWSREFREGELVVAGDGTAAWGQPDVSQRVFPVTLRRWFDFGALVWIEMSDECGGRFGIWLPKDANEAEPWRRLKVWLAWVRRSRPPISSGAA